MLDDAYVPPIQRVGDFHLMDIIIDSGKFTATQISRINYCRVYLSVHTVSDITKANGVWIHPEFMNGDRSKYTPTNQQMHIL